MLYTCPSTHTTTKLRPDWSELSTRYTHSKHASASVNTVEWADSNIWTQAKMLQSAKGALGVFYFEKNVQTISLFRLSTFKRLSLLT